MIHKFVEFIPKTLEDDVIYISVEYGAVTHKCCCGCGEKVFTPLSPTDWKLIFNGETISLSPSIGSWNLPCKSHYWIKNNKVKWAGQWTEEEIEYGRTQDSLQKEKYYNREGLTLNNDMSSEEKQEDKVKTKKSFWTKVKSLWG